MWAQVFLESSLRCFISQLPYSAAQVRSGDENSHWPQRPGVLYLNGVTDGPQTSQTTSNLPNHFRGGTDTEPQLRWKHSNLAFAPLFE